MPQEITCYLCGAECEVTAVGTHIITLYGCDYCGRYGIHEHVAINNKRDEIMKQKVACVAAERRLQQLDDYIITTEAVGEVLGRSTITMETLVASYPQTATDLLDRSLLNLRRMVDHPGDLIKLDVDHPTVLFSHDRESMVYVLSQFRKANFIADKDHMQTGQHAQGTSDMARNGFLIQSEGWGRIAELESSQSGDNPQAFVAMWFDGSMDDIYDNGIKPAIETDCGIKKCIKIDNIEHNDKICDKIIAEIRKSSFVVADFTAGCCDECEICERKEGCADQVRPRGGVYFEAGFALGLGIPVIWTVREDQIGGVHFDTRQYNHIVYKDPGDLRKQLANRIRVTIPGIIE